MTVTTLLDRIAAHADEQTCAHVATTRGGRRFCCVSKAHPAHPDGHVFVSGDGSAVADRHGSAS